MYSYAMTTLFRGGTAMHGHGALSNPAGRFERRITEAVDDGWFQEEVPDSAPLEIRPDHARTVISRNDSPDIPVEQSINPYRGCSHACPYCLAPDTPILMGDGSVRRLEQVPVGSEIYGTMRRGGRRRYVRTRVLAHWSVIKAAYRLVLEDGTELVAGGDHRFLTERGWTFVTGASGSGSRPRPGLMIGEALIGTGRFAQGVEKSADYERGYLRGIIRGDGLPDAHVPGVEADRRTIADELQLARCDEEALGRAHGYLSEFLAPARASRCAAAPGARRSIDVSAAASRASFAQISRLLAWPGAQTRAWCAGFLAGLYAAGGSCAHCGLRLCSSDPRLIERAGQCLGALGLRFVREDTRAGGAPLHRLRLAGELRERLRFLHSVDPALCRGLDLEAQSLSADARLRVASIEPAGAMRLYDMTTGTGDFIANGVVSHNCYARPSHAYLGLSPGLDFETRLVYKREAGRLLERELARPGYLCKTITLGSNTDPYQPVGRRLRVTRDILEVLARCRHPVSVVTKSALVLRDLDLLGALARDRLVRVSVSITTLDAELKRTMEPQAASPAARLRVVRELTAAGVPTGVLVAPVIPALTDHEIEQIVQAAAEAGARWAGYVLLRLPYEVGPLFREWLETHYPDRAPRVLSLIRQMRGGRDNDPRFGHRMRGTGPLAELLRSRFHSACRRAGLNLARGEPLDVSLFRRPGVEQQLTLGL
jgi:DNA repair photolyase